MRGMAIGWALCLANILVSTAVSLGVLYWAPGYAPSPKEVIFAANTNTKAIEELVKATNELAKRVNAIQPPVREVPNGQLSNSPK